MARADPRLVFAHADAFARAAARIRPTRSVRAEVGARATSPAVDAAPYLVMAALACELYLKCLLLVAKARYPRVHSLRALWGDLPADETEAVLRLHRRLYADHHPGASASEADAAFEGILDGARDAQQISRYVFEDDGPAPRADGVPDPTPVATVLRGRLLALDPSLAQG